MLSALEIIAHFDPLMWVIENRSGCRVDVTYCKYGTLQEADAAVDQHALEAEARQARQPAARGRTAGTSAPRSGGRG